MKLAILGASGHGKVVADTALAAGWQQVVFFDDSWPSVTTNGRWQVIGNSHDLLEQHLSFDGVVVGIGNNRIRLAKQQALTKAGAYMPVLIHPKAAVSSGTVLGAGTVVFAGAVVQIDTHCGEGCIINTNASVDHDCRLGAGVHVCPGSAVAGLVSIGECSWVGIGASIKQLMKVGHDVTIGAGAVVVDHVDDHQCVIGVPARPVVS